MAPLWSAVHLLSSSLVLFLAGSKNDSIWRSFCGPHDPFSPAPSFPCPSTPSTHLSPLPTTHTHHTPSFIRSLVSITTSTSTPLWHGVENGTFPAGVLLSHGSGFPVFTATNGVSNMSFISAASGSSSSSSSSSSSGSRSSRSSTLLPRWVTLMHVSPCLQHASNIFFTSFIILAAISHALVLPQLPTPPPTPSLSAPFYLKLIAFLCSSIPAIGWLTLTVIETLISEGYLPAIWPRSLLPPHELAFSLSQGVFLAITVVLLRLAASRDYAEPIFYSARVWLINHAMTLAMLAIPAGLRVTHAAARHSETGRIAGVFPSDVAVLATLPFAFYLVVVALTGSFSCSRRHAGQAAAGEADEESGSLSAPLLCDQQAGSSDSSSAPTELAGVTPFASAGLLSTLIFSWVTPLLEEGLRKPLRLEDIPRLRDIDSSDANFNAFDASWQKQKAAAAAAVARGKKDASPSITWALFRTHWFLTVLTAVLVVGKTAVMYAGPLLLSSFVDYAAGVRLFAWEGPVLVLALLVSKLAESALDHQYYFRAELLGLHVRASLIGALYRKGLRLSTKSKQTHTVGEIVNYMSVDAQRLGDFVWELHNIWVLPLQILVALVILFKVVGASMFAGLGVMFLIMLLNLAVSGGLQSFITNIMECKDKRMKATSEALNAMRVIKLYAWQDFFQSKLDRLRASEANWIAGFMGLGAINIFLLWLSPLAVSVATFAAMVWLGAPLTPGSVFTAIATFRVLQEPLRSFPGVISSVMQSVVYLKRLNAFLNDQELQSDAVVRLPAGTVWGGSVVPPEVSAGESGREGVNGEEDGAGTPSGAAASAAAQAASSSDREKGLVSGSSEAGSIAELETAEWSVVVQGGVFNWEGVPGEGESEGEKKEGAEEKKEAEGEEGTADAADPSDTDSSAPKATLSDIQLCVKRGMRVAVCGSVGSGKSSLLSCLLGEVPRVQGRVVVAGRVAYVPQSAWIQNATVRDNILFGRELEEERYAEVLRCCALEKDLLLFSHGDKTQIGERGVNMSGGQKQRIQLARALYQDADVYLLDDPFSAVDAHTGSELFLEYVLKALQGKTVILVTHQVEFLPAVDYILVMKDGRIAQSGRYDDLLASGADFTALVDAHNEALQSVTTATEDAESSAAASASTAADVVTNEGASKVADLADGPKEGTLKEGKEGDGEGGGDGGGGGDGQLISEEEREAGRVSLKVYWAYLTRAMGGWHVPLLILVQLLWQALQIGSDWWLAAYTSEASAVGPDPVTPVGFLSLYSLLAIGSGFFVFLRTIVIAWAGVSTAQAFFRGMLKAVFRAPMSFFDSTPVGRILSRASTDQATLDMDIPFICGSLLAMLFQLVGILFVASYITWPVLYAIVPLVYFYISYQEYYLTSSRELSRLQGITKAPVIEHFSESIAGAAVIRAFDELPRFCARSARTVDANNTVNLHYGATSTWLGIHLELMGNLLLCFSALLLVALPNSLLSPGLAGMSLSYGLALSQNLYFLISIWCALENNMVSAERIMQYSDDSIPHEAPLVVANNRPATDWPTAGDVVFQDIQVRYRPDLPLVLKGVSLHVRGGEKAGIVGRTGSGKSTLVSALFRLVEPCSGDLRIDGCDCLALGLADLRSRLAIIPQDPTLFNGTVRYNLDPADKHTDEEIWEALEKCQLKESVGAMDDKLQATVAEGGENWSVGQRQLFCLGRALLKRTRILVLDEATASVDSATDAIIQRTIREAFADATVISIAHRIPTVMDSDKVVVMDQGLVAELDAPAKLLEDRNSMFSRLVAEYAARSSDMADIAKSSSVENLAAVFNTS